MTKQRNGLGRRWMSIGVLAVGLLGLVACGSDGESPDAAPTESAGDDASDGSEVVMRLIAYKPAKLEVPAGTTVMWKQQDAGFHTVTSGSVTKDASGSVKTNADGRFDSGQLAEDEEFTRTFDETGTYTYFCKVHPATMSGEVTVE